MSGAQQSSMAPFETTAPMLNGSKGSRSSLKRCLVIALLVCALAGTGLAVLVIGFPDTWADFTDLIGQSEPANSLTIAGSCAGAGYDIMKLQPQGACGQGSASRRLSAVSSEVGLRGRRLSSEHFTCVDDRHSEVMVDNVEMESEYNAQKTKAQKLGLEASGSFMCVALCVARASYSC